jgi:hypothetical protein
MRAAPLPQMVGKQGTRIFGDDLKAGSSGNIPANVQAGDLPFF